MLSIKRIKELLPDRDLTNKEAEAIRNDLRSFAEIIFEEWRKDVGLKVKLEKDRSERVDYESNTI